MKAIIAILGLTLIAGITWLTHPDLINEAVASVQDDAKQALDNPTPMVSVKTEVSVAGKKVSEKDTEIVASPRDMKKRVSELYNDETRREFASLIIGAWAKAMTKGKGSALHEWMYTWELEEATKHIVTKDEEF